jgi:hypothetical protein
VKPIPGVPMPNSTSVRGKWIGVPTTTRHFVVLWLLLRLSRTSLAGARGLLKVIPSKIGLAGSADLCC